MAGLETLLKLKPFPAVTVAEVAAAASLSPATLYQRFSNQDALGSVLLELYYSRVEAWAQRPRTAPFPTSLRDALRRIAEDAFDQVEALGHILRPAYLYSRQHPDRTGPEWSRLEQLARRGFADFIAAHASDIAPADRDDAARVLFQLVNLQVVGLLLHGAQDRERFVGDLVELADRYLAGPRR